MAVSLFHLFLYIKTLQIKHFLLYIIAIESFSIVFSDPILKFCWTKKKNYIVSSNRNDGGNERLVHIVSILLIYARLYEYWVGIENEDICIVIVKLRRQPHLSKY